MLARIRDFVESINQTVLWGIGVVAILALAVFYLTRTSPGVDTEQIELTMYAASTQSNLHVPTLAAHLTQTPVEAALTGSAPTLALAGRREIRQFAASAFASSERGTLAQGAVQAAGPPSTPDCGDFRTAWASEFPNEVATLTLIYPELVTPTGLQIYQTYNPGFVTRIEMSDIYGEAHVVYEAAPQPQPQCPFVLIVPIERAGFHTSRVTITVDQSTSAGGWSQIDAVELIGIKH